MAQLPSYLLNSRLARSGMSDTVTTLGIRALPPHVSLDNDRFTLVDESGVSGEVSLALVAGVVYVNPNYIRLYYRDAYSVKEKSSPECVSYDGAAPHGSSKEPQAARCAACQWAKFGSATTGTGAGQACAQKHPIVVVPLGSDKPYYLQIPPASLGAWADYSAWLKDQVRSNPDFAQLKANGLELLPLVKTEFTFVAGTKRLQFRAVGILPEQQLLAHEALDEAEVKALAGPPQDYTPPPTRPVIAAPAEKAVLQSPVFPPRDEAPPAAVVEPPKRSRGRPPVSKPALVPDPAPKHDLGGLSLLGLAQESEPKGPGNEGVAEFGDEPQAGGVLDEAPGGAAPADSVEAMMSRALGIG